MARRSLGVTMAVAVLALMAGAALGQGDCMRDSLAAHNEYRAQHGALPLEWDDALAARERVWVTQLAEAGCSLVHSPGNLENLYAAWGSITRQDQCRAAADSWYSETKYYKFDSKTPYTSSIASLPRNVQPPAAIGHLTQMLWRSASKVGCFTATGPDGCVVVGCAYDDGNSPADSAHLENVKPKGTPVPDSRPAVSTADELSYCPSFADQGACLGGTTLGDTGRLIARVCPKSCEPALQQQRQEWLDAADALGPIDPPNTPVDGPTGPGDVSPPPADAPTPSPASVLREAKRYIRTGYPWLEGDAWNLDAAKSRCEKDNGAGNCEEVGMEVYPKCAEGFVKFGCCFCDPDPFANAVAARRSRFF